MIFAKKDKVSVFLFDFSCGINIVLPGSNKKINSYDIH
jgi:hypothetical protein